ncbi:glycine zipper domain-containing protein [Agrobacterium cavarae]|nr:glycine zipper domain-containing protein [Agrobacterium cavarae]
MDDFAEETKQKTSELDNQLKDGNDIGEGIGAAAGASIGGVIGGAPGAIVGGTIGKAVGSLFEVEITEQRVSFDIIVPEFGIEDQEWIFTMPQISMQNEDIIFDIPSVKMKTIEGPPKPEFTIRWSSGFPSIPETVVTWTPTYIDVPEYTTVQHRIVVGIPQVTMVDEKIVIGVPTVKVTSQSITMDIPSITIKSKQDLSNSVAAAGKKIAEEAELVAEAKRQSLKTRMRVELLPRAQDMFLCHRGTLEGQRSSLDSRLSAQIEIATNTLITLKGQSVPETDDDYVKAKNTVDTLIEQRKVQLEKFDIALADLDRASKNAIEKMLEN